MPKNVLISLKYCKNRQTLGAAEQTSLPLGALPPDPHISQPTL